ncbi:PRMT5-domain-containing protein [Artomyces pyxidatus]|uniref:PRMT5-domain-containing protein n=1 Tax=Artomyces pyxidatus TaxID=48021 RepID=A0ACB8T7M4_9AGAM|nr:PRMT5-domain-containing protein [Artomyces pyxidatus]
MSSWDITMALATSLSLDDLPAQSDPPSGDPSEFDTPVLAAVAAARARTYDAVCLPLTNTTWRDRWTRMCILSGDRDGDTHAEAEARAEAWRANPVFELEELTMTRLDEAEGVIAMVSDWLELDASDDWVRHDSEIALQQELSYASYLDVQTAVLPPPRNRGQIASYGRAINTCLARTPYMQLSIRLPIYDPSIFQSDAAKPSASPPPLATPDSVASFDSRPSTPEIRTPDLRNAPSTKASEAELNATWEMWDIVRSICAYNPRLTLTLDLTPPLPSVPGVLNRWAAEPIRHVFLPASTFIANGKGYPVLPKGSQTFIRDIMKHRPVVILAGAARGRHARGGEAAYLQYVRHLEKTSAAVRQAATAGTVEHFARGYQDFLQAPLQPLMDNLQSVTYQTFEQDPVKYQKYEEAVFRALAEWPPAERIVIAVAGAGRGPLVARCLAAAERAQRSAFVYALEKNPSAYVTLQRRKAAEWGARVALVFGDMRGAALPEQADILVSELLGSFGDNELSPECLDGAQRLLKPDGISIPASYSAYMAPLSSSKLYNEVRAGKDQEKAAETPYVVMFQAVNLLSGHGGGTGGRCGPQVQECWYFEHPRRDGVLGADGVPPTNSHNTRSAQMTFHIPHAGVLHGLAGYFEATLYGDVGLSIHPQRKDLVSKDMLSWFPIFFPLKEPLYLPSNAELQVSIWRLTNARQVWYEWYAESFLPVLHPAPAQPPPGPAPRVDGRGSFVAAPATPFATPSPVVEAMDNPFLADRPPARLSPKRVEEDDARRDAGVVKIGQTTLHNPGGRSSWIGL